MNKDSVSVKFTTEYDEFNQKIEFDYTEEIEKVITLKKIKDLNL